MQETCRADGRGQPAEAHTRVVNYVLQLGREQLIIQFCVDSWLYLASNCIIHTNIFVNSGYKTVKTIL